MLLRALGGETDELGAQASVREAVAIEAAAIVIKKKRRKKRVG